MSRPTLILTCEHATNAVPRPYRALFAGHERLLASHRGWDRGAVELARTLARRLEASLLETRATRLLVDTNRSAQRPGVFSTLTRTLPAPERALLLEAWHTPHREAVARAVQAALRRTSVLHLGVHSFTPVLAGRRRPTQVGLLFDPQRARERAFAERLRTELAALEPRLRIHFNRPYRGDSDGLTTTLRGRFAASRFLGLELELNQAFPRGPRARWLRLQHELALAMERALEALRP